MRTLRKQKWMALISTHVQLDVTLLVPPAAAVAVAVAVVVVAAVAMEADRIFHQNIVPL
jgi:hypothetical protein